VVRQHPGHPRDEIEQFVVRQALLAPHEVHTISPVAHVVEQFSGIPSPGLI